MVELDRQTTWLNGAVMYLDALQQDLLWFPGGLYFDVPRDSKAVYIGTLHYIRNEFNTIKHVKIINEYEQTLNALSLQSNDVTVSLLTYPENEPKPYIAQTAPSPKIITLSAYGDL
jgi:hypothetical protein